MQCPECSYISFKIEKACKACGCKFKKKPKSPSLQAKESFSIFSTPPVKEKQKVAEKKENGLESVGLLEAPEPESFIDSETGDFKLDLPEIENYEIGKAQALSDSDKEIFKYESLEFGPNAVTYLREMDEKGLGNESFETTEEEKTEETQSMEAEPVSIEKNNTSNETPSLEPELEITESKEEPAIFTELALESSEPVEESDLSMEPVLEIPETEGGHLTPELDLGENEIKLQLSYESLSPNESGPAVDVPDLNFKVGDSEGTLITQNNEIPDIELQDLGSKLKSSDEPEKDKS